MGASLYTPSSPGGLQLVGSYTLAAGSQNNWNIVTGLNLSINKKYYFIFSGRNFTTTGVQMNLYFNGDTTNTNYYCQRVYNTSTTNSSARENQPLVINTVNSGEPFFVQGVIYVDPAGKLTIRGSSVYNNSTTLEIMDWGIQYTQVIAAITAITATYNASTACFNGAKFDLYQYYY